MRANVCRVRVAVKVLDKPCNRVVWSPAANTCVLCGLDVSGVTRLSVMTLRALTDTM
jgi:hypothetical protein